MHFYTLGNIARTGPIELLYDERGQHARQVLVLPESASGFFRPDTYPPLAALLFAPLTYLPFAAAGLAWVLVTLISFCLGVFAIVRQSQPISPLRDRGFVLAAVIGFPPVWSLLMHGQTSILPFVAFAAAWFAAAEGRSRFIAGLAVGLLALKPQFGVLIAVVALVRREWALVIGAVTSVALQLALTISMFGQDIVWRYFDTVLSVLLTAHKPETKPYLQHSLRVITALLPLKADAILLVVLSAAVAWIVVDVWRVTGNWRIRMGTLVIGSVLINPHLYVYDATVLVLAGLWLGEEVGYARWFWQRAYWTTLTLFLPTAYVIKLQLSVVLMMEVLVQVWLRTRSGEIGLLRNGAEDLDRAPRSDVDLTAGTSAQVTSA